MGKRHIISKQYISSHTSSCLYTEKFTFPSNGQITEHGHEFFEIGITLCGKAAHDVQGLNQTLNPGSIYCIPTGTTHAITVSEDWTVYNIYLFPTAFTSHYLDKTSYPYNLLRYFLIKICGKQQDSLFYQLSDATLQSIYMNFHLVENYPFISSGSYSLYCEHCIMNILLLLAEEYVLQFCGKSIPFDSRIMQITQYVLTHLEQPTNLLLSNLSEELMLNRQYINRIVKKEIGIPISQYIHQCKIEKSMECLTSGLSISETAYFLGFYDQSHFHKYFLKYAGISPTKFIHSDSFRKYCDTQHQSTQYEYPQKY